MRQEKRISKRLFKSKHRMYSTTGSINELILDIANQLVTARNMGLEEEFMAVIRQHSKRAERDVVKAANMIQKNLDAKGKGV